MDNICIQIVFVPIIILSDEWNSAQLYVAICILTTVDKFSPMKNFYMTISGLDLHNSSPKIS